MVSKKIPMTKMRRRIRILRKALRDITDLDCSYDRAPVGKAHEIAERALKEARG